MFITRWRRNKQWPKCLFGETWDTRVVLGGLGSVRYLFEYQINMRILWIREIAFRSTVWEINRTVNICLNYSVYIKLLISCFTILTTYYIRSEEVRLIILIKNCNKTTYDHVPNEQFFFQISCKSWNLNAIKILMCILRSVCILFKAHLTVFKRDSIKTLLF